MFKPSGFPRVDGDPFRVLVVEDNVPDVLLIAEALNEEGLKHELIHLGDGDEAVSRLARGCDETLEFDLVILDLNMPRVGGMEVLTKFRSTPKLENVPILILTSSLSPEEQSEANQLGVDLYLKKPVDLDEFLSVVGGAARSLVMRGARR